MPRLILKISFTVLCLFFCGNVKAQKNVTGTWNGVFMSTEFDLGQPRLVVEIYDFKDSIFNGITHLYYNGYKYEHYKMVGRYFKKDSILVFIEAATIAVDLGIYGNCLGTYSMQLSKQQSGWRMEGNWISNIPGCSPDTRVILTKKIEKPTAPVPSSKLPAASKKAPSSNKPTTPAGTKKREKLAVITPETTPRKTMPAIKMPATALPLKLTQRETDVQSLLEINAVDKDSIKVEVYDNGDIDGDSVSVYEDGLQRINRKLITAKPITFYVSLDKNINPICHLRLVAESLGTIPPCTALMVVTTKSKRYEVRLSSNFSKNATVELFLKE